MSLRGAATSNVIAQSHRFHYHKLPEPWQQIVEYHIEAAIDYHELRFVNAYEKQKELVILFQNSMRDWDNWCLHVLYVFMQDFQYIASKADRQMEAMTGEEENKDRYLKTAATLISKSFSICINDRMQLRGSKKWGVYRLSGILLGVYIKLGQLNLCTNVTKAIKVAELPEFYEFPKGDQVTYLYYSGRLAFAEQNYAQAEIALHEAFRKCTIRSTEHKDMILFLLVPIRMLRGILPSPALLDRYPNVRDTYGGVASAIKAGNVRAFMDALDENEQSFIKYGTYFAVERARSIALRRLFHRVYHLLDRPKKILLHDIQVALTFVGLPLSMEEVEWTMANLIFNGFIKAYISHEHLTLVLSLRDPFPPLTLGE
ncbi:hypothetical protein DM01DRAFT_321602 [Hesseltinella vesiculosa]|uniref:PCI domain-containing protein n=1 Tax=Hesseltinella vesiculosa TaxID=101127 RepID=A0A1X2G5S3_9FUNG|nr:hypothetical protein DM01DRAFT_321602 [Hesseltinella vesiculosa]